MQKVLKSLVIMVPPQTVLKSLVIKVPNAKGTQIPSDYGTPTQVVLTFLGHQNPCDTPIELKLINWILTEFELKLNFIIEYCYKQLAIKW
jgi:hypothetical protein